MRDKLTVIGNSLATAPLADPTPPTRIARPGSLAAGDSVDRPVGGMSGWCQFVTDTIIWSA